MNDHPADRLAQAFRDLMEQRRQDYQERRRRITELETELSEPTERYRRQSAAVMPGSGQDLAEYYDWRHSREQELAELRQRQQEVERHTLPRTARREAEAVIRQEARAAMPSQRNEKQGSVNFRKPIADADRHRQAAGNNRRAPAA